MGIDSVIRTECKLPGGSKLLKIEGYQLSGDATNR